MVQPHAVLEVAYGILDLGVTAMVGLQFEQLPVPVGDEAVIAVGGEESQLRTGRRLHPPDDEPYRRGVRLGGRPPYDFEVSTPDGEQVWNWKCGKIINQPGDGKTLEPGEELEFVGEWEQVDNRGEPVPPGVYLVRGGLNLGPPNAGPPGVVITTAQKVEVLK